MAETKSDSKKRNELIYVIAGKDLSLVSIQCEELLNRLLEPQQRATGLFNADADRVSITAVLDELRTLPFLSDKRVVLVRYADDFVSENRELLEKYFDSPCPTGILILTVESWPGNTKLARKLPKVGRLISVERLKSGQLPPLLVKYANDTHSKKLTKDAAELLVELAGDDLGRLYSEIDKLAAFANDEKSIMVSHIESLIGHNRLFNAFAVIDAVTAGNVAGAVERLRNMFAEDKSAEYTVVGAFAFHFRRLFNAKVLLEKGVHQSEVVKNLRIWSGQDSFFSQLRKMSLKQLGENLQRLAEMDYAIKTGRTKADVAAEQLVLRLAAG